MSLSSLIKAIDPETYEKLKRAIEIGKWPDGRSLSEEQKELTMQAIIAYEIENNIEDSQRTGFVDTGDSACHSDEGHLEPKPIKWH